VEVILDTLARREIVIGLAVAGAGLATLGSVRRAGAAPGPVRNSIVYLGYALTGVSILLFIIAGFRS
jgi:hypothetical protein